MPFNRRWRRPTFSEIKVTDSFWSTRQQTLVRTTLPTQFSQLESTGRLENFRRVIAGEQGKFSGFWFNDSDVYKWLEAVAYGLAIEDSAELRANADIAIDLIARTQRPDGYLNTYIQYEKPDMAWKNLSMMHEMYCGGHLLEAAAAWHDALGDDRLLKIAVKFADHVMSIFGPDRRLGYCGHEEFEYGLIRLARATGETKYREFARWQVDTRGTRPSPFEPELTDEVALSMHRGQVGQCLRDGAYNGEYLQDHAPVREHTSVVGHAVRAMYLYMAATDLADGENDTAMETALRRCWDSLTKRRMYVTAGIGPSGDNEGFTNDYDLPNGTAYAETCAAIGLIFWGQLLLEQTGESDFADIVERSLYNGTLSGISISGDHYFYDNPLESRGQHERTPWFPCACCPPNIARLLGTIGQLAVGIGEDGVALHLPIGLTVETPHATISVSGNYPWESEVSISVEPKTAEPFSVAVRIPDWADELGLELESADEPADYQDGYAVYHRVWSAGDVIKVDFGTEPKWVEANPAILDDLGRVALSYGPLIYCAESTDNGILPQRAAVLTEQELTVTHEDGLLGGVTTITAPAIVDADAFPDGLYADLGTITLQERDLKFIPYYAWNNRGKSSMQVWLRRA